jgi:hypothetical protein
LPHPARIPLAAALAGVAAASAAPAHADVPTINVTGDSILVTDQAPGPTTVRAIRPDAVTHKPVVIGQYAGVASSLGPFSVNTTVPSALLPNGDCWQQGALASAVTPDLQPGDTVTVTQTPAGGQATSTSVAVTPSTPHDSAGPIPGCRDIAPFARNAVTRSPDRVAGGAIELSGVAQPFATRVSLSAVHGSVSTAPVAVRPGQGGAWSASIPARQVARLPSGPLLVTPVFEVPDVSTGATAHIAAGPAIRLSKTAARGGSRPPANGELAGARVPRRLGLRSARRKGIRASFVVPAGARVVRIQLRRGGTMLLQRVVPAGTAGTRQTVRLRGPRLRRVLHRGRFRVALSAGPSLARLGAPVTRTISIR